jgi:hypothetical protein
LKLFQAEYSRTVFVDEFDDASAAPGNAGQWIVCDDDGQAGFFHQQLVDVTQQRAAAREYDSAVSDI